MSNLGGSSNTSSIPGPFSSNFSSDQRGLNYAHSAPETSISSERSVFWPGTESQSPSSVQISNRGGVYDLLNIHPAVGEKSPRRTDGLNLLLGADPYQTANIAESSRNMESLSNANVGRIPSNHRILGINSDRTMEAHLGGRVHPVEDMDRVDDRADFRDRFRDAYTDRLLDRFAALPRSQSSRLRESYGDRFGDRFRDEYGDGMLERSIEWGNERGVEYPRIEGTSRRRNERGDWRDRREETSRIPSRPNNDITYPGIDSSPTLRNSRESYNDTMRYNTIGNGYGGGGGGGGYGAYNRGNGNNTNLSLGTYPVIDSERSHSDFSVRPQPTGLSMLKSLCQEMYKVDWKPKEFFVKFRQHVGKFRLGANVEFRRKLVDEEEQQYRDLDYEDRFRGRRPPVQSPFPSIWGFEIQNYKVKFTLKPAKRNPQWKILCEPQQGDIRFLSRKINVANLFNFQIGVGHDFHYHTTGLKWKISSPIAGINPPQIRHKNRLPVFPGCDLRVGWNADYSFPHLHGSLGTGEPIVGLNLGRLNASIERVEAIFTHLH